MRTTDVYIRTDETLARVAERIGSILGVPMEPVGEPVGVEYWVESGGCGVFVGKSEGLVDDGDRRFTEYDYYVEVRTYDEDARSALARRIFEALRGMRYPVMLTLDVDEKLDEWP